MVQSGSPSMASSSWVHTFYLPDCFSSKTMAAIHRGQITKAVRIEIIAAMHTRMLQHTLYPTANEYRTACQRLVDKYPVDKLGNKIVSICNAYTIVVIEVLNSVSSLRF